MFTSLSSAFIIFKNLGKIKEVLNVAYTAVIKLHTVLTFLDSQTDNTKLGKLLDGYLPKTVEVLEKIIDIFKKYGKYIDLDTTVVAQSILSESTLIEELEKSNKELNGLLK
jgi:ferritin-like metal-binding protein YciE